MTNRKVLLISFLTAMSGACAGCTTNPPALKPLGKATVKVIAEERTSRATVRLANEVVILLPAPNPPGHLWQIAQHNSNMLQQLTEVIPGAGPAGEATISFVARRTGFARVMFVLVPPGGKTEVEPAKVHEIQLTIE